MCSGAQGDSRVRGLDSAKSMCQRRTSCASEDPSSFFFCQFSFGMRTGTIEMEPRAFNQDVYSNGGPAASVEMVHSEAARCRREAARMNDVAQPGPARPCGSGQLALEEQGSTAGGLCSVLDTRHCCSQSHLCCFSKFFVSGHAPVLVRFSVGW